MTIQGSTRNGGTRSTVTSGWSLRPRPYWISRNEDYILNWIEVYTDWMDTYPCKMESMPVGGDYNNEDYEWKGLQVAERVLSQINIIPYYIQSENFTPEWLCTVLHAVRDSPWSR